ncbi:MAG: peptidoglycan DD-metalloendopeptidase family protein [bacterium]|nr:peptidoglycan DD-metalloendopeptidase family protein [bacterium]
MSFHLLKTEKNTKARLGELTTPHGVVKTLVFIISLLIIMGFMVVSLEAAPITNWENYEVSVRDGLIDKTKAKADLPGIIKDLRQICASYDFTGGQTWIFPLRGYSLTSIAPKGSDFQPSIVYGVSPVKGYNFFDGNRHGGHPAHDIFIRDKDQNTLDDQTKQQVDALAMVDSVVLSIYTGWQKNSKLRGGNYIWLYNPKLDMFFYYAHLDKILVSSGDFVKAGTEIGTVGRTGLLAYEKTSPTHVHLMVLKYENGLLKPYEYYPELKNVR